MLKTLQAFQEIRESFDVGDLTYESYFPDDLVPEYRPHLKTVAAHLTALKSRILRALALSLGLEKEFFIDCHKNVFRQGNLSTLRSLYYPAIKGSCDTQNPDNLSLVQLV